MGKVTAIISSYKAGKNLEKCIKDLLAQTVVPEIVIIAVKPSHEELNVLAKYGDSIIYKVFDERIGVYEAWNEAIKLSSGDYITNANVDDRHEPNFIEVLSSAIKDFDVVYANQYMVEEPDDYSQDFKMDYYDFDKELLSYVYYLGCQPMWRKELHNKYGYFDESFESSGDWEFFLRVADKAKFRKVSEFLGYYCNDPDSLSNTSEKRKEEDQKLRNEYVPKYKETTLSLCAIIRDEEKFIYNFLKCNHLCADEIVLCDTGSVDKTQEEIRKFHKEFPDTEIRIIHREWNDDFAEARNEAIKACTKDYILVLDADERLVNPRIVIPSIIPNRGFEAFSIKVRCPNAVRTDALLVIDLIRLFKNNGYYFRGACHETLDYSLFEKGISPMPIPVLADHLGYAVSPEKNKEKCRRNLALLIKEVDSNPDNAYARFQLGYTYYLLGNRSRATKEFDKALELGVGKPLAANILLTKAHSSIEKGNHKKALSYCEKSLSLAPEQSEGRVTKAVCHVYLEEKDKAIKELECVRMRAKEDPAFLISNLANDKQYSIEMIEKSINSLKGA